MLAWPELVDLAEMAGLSELEEPLETPVRLALEVMGALPGPLEMEVWVPSEALLGISVSVEPVGWPEPKVSEVMVEMAVPRVPLVSEEQAEPMAITAPPALEEPAASRELQGPVAMQS